jgi:hypothetical protein
MTEEEMAAAVEQALAPKKKCPRCGALLDVPSADSFGRVSTAGLRYGKSRGKTPHTKHEVRLVGCQALYSGDISHEWSNGTHFLFTWLKRV